MAKMVRVRKKDLVNVIQMADDYTEWDKSSWKARKRLLDAVSEESESIWGGDTVSEAEYNSWCRIPACGCPGDFSHP